MINGNVLCFKMRFTRLDKNKAQKRDPLRAEKTIKRKRVGQT